MSDMTVDQAFNVRSRPGPARARHLELLGSSCRCCQTLCKVIPSDCTAVCFLAGCDWRNIRLLTKHTHTHTHPERQGRMRGTGLSSKAGQASQQLTESSPENHPNTDRSPKKDQSAKLKIIYDQTTPTTTSLHDYYYDALIALTSLAQTMPFCTWDLMLASGERC